MAPRKAASGIETKEVLVGSGPGGLLHAGALQSACAELALSERSLLHRLPRQDSPLQQIMVSARRQSSTF